MKRVLITGASKGIGRAIAEKIAGEGFSLYLQGRDQKRLLETAERAHRKGATVEIYRQELSDAESVIKSMQAFRSNCESLDILVNNAGITCVKDVPDISLEEWQKILDVNVTAPFIITREVLPIMKKGSIIVNILSSAARTGYPGWSAYCMSKFAMEGWSQSLREELRPQGIRVINIYPSATNTDIWNQVPGQWPREKMMQPSDVAAAVHFAVTRRDNVMIENITMGDMAGKL